MENKDLIKNLLETISENNCNLWEDETTQWRCQQHYKIECAIEQLSKLLLGEDVVINESFNNKEE